MTEMEKMASTDGKEADGKPDKYVNVAEEDHDRSDGEERFDEEDKRQKK